MNWQQLLSLKRFGDTTTRYRMLQDETRLGFEVDYDRIIFSDYFRSLQNKTQVVPFSNKDFVHTRLTHSLEVSVVGRSLGRIAGKAILEKHPELQKDSYKFNDFGAIVAAAALAHDIGNPPFGHSGEKAISEYFKTENGQQYKEMMKPAEWQDLTSFEGNANGFRLLTLSREGVSGGLRLSYATLGAFIKYPKPSLPKVEQKNKAFKKYGIFQNDLMVFKDVAKDLGLQKVENHQDVYYRHPLAFLVEASDDICYSIIDFEDGINMGLIPEEKALEYLLNLVRENLKTEKYNQLKSQKDRLSYLRALAIQSLINEAVSIFLANEEAILNGTYPHALLEKSRYKAQLEDIIAISVEKMYRSPEVIEKEIQGYHIIHKLLDIFLTAVNNTYDGKETAYDRLIFNMLPEVVQVNDKNLYNRILNICSYIAGMSDRQALSIYDKLK